MIISYNTQSFDAEECMKNQLLQTTLFLKVPEASRNVIPENLLLASAETLSPYNQYLGPIPPKFQDYVDEFTS